MAIKHVVTRGYGFGDDTLFIPTHGFTPAVVVVRYAMHYQLAVAVRDAILALNLDGITTKVYLRKVLTDRRLTPPFVVVAYQGQEQVIPGTNERDDWGYPVPVAIVAAGNQDLSASNTELLWREDIRKAFHHKRLSGVSGHYLCRVEPGPVIDPELFKHNLDASFLTIRCLTRESRS